MKPDTKTFWAGALIALTMLGGAGCKRADNSSGDAGTSGATGLSERRRERAGADGTRLGCEPVKVQVRARYRVIEVYPSQWAAIESIAPKIGYVCLSRAVLPPNF